MPGRGLVAASDSTPLVRESCAVACIHDHQHHPRAPAPAQAALPSSPCGTADEKTERVFALPFKNHLSVNHSARADASVYSVHFAARRENRRNGENRDARTENARDLRRRRTYIYMRAPREIEVVRRGSHKVAVEVPCRVCPAAVRSRSRDRDSRLLCARRAGIASA